MKGQIPYRQFPPILLALLVCSALFVGFLSRPLETFAPDPPKLSLANLAGRASRMEQTAELEGARAREAYGKLPLSFEMNVGQTDHTVRFLARGAGYSLFLTRDEAVLSLRKCESGSESSISGPTSSSDRQLGPDTQDQSLDFLRSQSMRNLDKASGDSNEKPPDVLKMRLIGANKMSDVSAEDEQEGRSNYSIGNDPTKWLANVGQYANECAV